MIQTTSTSDLLLAHFATIADAPGGIARLRRLILQLAVQGRLVEQDPSDEPASALLERIRAEKARLGVKTKESEQLIDANLLASLPPSWMWTTLSELGFVNPRNNVVDEQEVAFVPMALVPQEYGEPVQTEVRQWGEVKKGFTHFAESDVVLAKITPCFQNGKAAVMRKLRNRVGAGTTELHVFRPILDTVVPEYVYIYLKSPNFISEGIPRMTGTAGQKRVPNDYFALNPFPLPPLAEQRRIVARVEQLMALCDALEARQARRGEERRRLLAALVGALLGARDSGEAAAAWGRLSASFDLVLAGPEDVAPLRQAVLQLAVQGRLVAQDPSDEPASALLERMGIDIKKRQEISEKLKPFTIASTWEWIRFGEVFDIQGGTQPPKNKFINHPSSGYVRLLQIRDFGERPVPTYVPVESVRSFCQPDDVMLARYGASVGKIFMGQEGAYNVALTKIVFNKDCIFNLFVYCLLRSFLFQRHLDDASRSAQAGFNKGDLFPILLPLPPLAEQRRIVARVEQLMALCDALEAKLREGRAAVERLAEALCAAVAGTAAFVLDDRPAVDEPVLLELPRRILVFDLDAYAAFSAYVVQRHYEANHNNRLGTVKLEKIAHLAEPYTGVDLGRQPRALPHGPADPELLSKVMARGQELGAFRAVPREDAEFGYRFEPLPNLDNVAKGMDEAFGEYAARLRELVELLLPLRTRQAEAVATLYAVWNDMLRAGTQPDDEEIFAAFHAFHPQKEHFSQETLNRWLAWMRHHGIVPDGTAKPTLPTTLRAKPSTHSPADATYDAAVALLAERGTLTNGELQAALGLDAAAARALLKQLVVTGVARQEGERRGTRYVRV